MANVFDSLVAYGEKWQKTGERQFSAEEKAAVLNAMVTSHEVEGNVLKSVCFTMKSGGVRYIPLSVNSFASVGDAVDLNTAKLVTIHRNGDGDRLRVEL